MKNIIVKDTNDEDTNVIVGASNDITGNIKYGGDWILENTSEDVETIYFTQNINYYEYLLDNATWLVSNSNNETAGIVTMYDSVTTKNIMFVSSGMTNWGFGCNFPPTTGTNNWNNGTEFGVTANPSVYGMTVFTSAFTNTATNTQFVIAALSNNSIGYFYNFILNQNTGTTTGGRSGSISTNATWLATGATMSTTTNVALYNNRLFYSLPNGNIGSAIITDATVPTIGSNNVTYINTTLLSSSTTLYPIGLTTDTNGYLYTALGNVTSAPTTGVIKVINVTSTPTLSYTISLTNANITSWGNPYALIWNSNKLYIGTTIGVATSATTGTIVYCNTISGVGTTVTSTLSTYKTGTKSISGMAITASSLYTSSLKSSGTTVSQYDIVVTVTKGFYNQITDIVGNFSSIPQLTSFPTFNGISNFSTKYRIKNAGVEVDLALLYALNSTPITASYNTSMYTYVGGTKYDLSSLFTPPITPITPITPILNGINNYQLNQYTYFIYSSTTFTVSINCVAYVILVGSGGAGNGGLANNAGGGGGGSIFANINLRSGLIYTATIGDGSSVVGNSTFLGVEGNTLSLTGYGGGKGGNNVVGAQGGTEGLNSTDVINPPAFGFLGGIGGAYNIAAGGGTGVSLNTTTNPAVPVSMYNSALTFNPQLGWGAGGGGGGPTRGGFGGSGAVGGLGGNKTANNTGSGGGYGCGGGGARRIAGSVAGPGGAGFIYIYAPPQSQ